jgi:hypothetical protein
VGKTPIRRGAVTVFVLVVLTLFLALLTVADLLPLLVGSSGSCTDP